MQNQPNPAPGARQAATAEITAPTTRNAEIAADGAPEGALTRRDMIRAGAALDHDPNAVTGIEFEVEVVDEYTELWSEGVSVFHNPNALYPLPAEHFPDFFHHYSKDGQVETIHNGGFHPLWSVTQIIRP